jgi:translation initiation factor 5A
MPGHDKIPVPIIDKLNAQVLSVSGSNANVMDMESYETFDLKIPGELKNKVIEGSTVLYWDILGEKVMKQVKGE